MAVYESEQQSGIVYYVTVCRAMEISAIQSGGIIFFCVTGLSLHGWEEKNLLN